MSQPPHLHLAGTQRQAKERESFIAEKKRGTEALIRSCQYGEAGDKKTRKQVIG